MGFMSRRGSARPPHQPPPLWGQPGAEHVLTVKSGGLAPVVGTLLICPPAAVVLVQGKSSHPALVVAGISFLFYALAAQQLVLGLQLQQRAAPNSTRAMRVAAIFYLLSLAAGMWGALGFASLTILPLTLAAMIYTMWLPGAQHAAAAVVDAPAVKAPEAAMPAVAGAAPAADNRALEELVAALATADVEKMKDL